MREIAGIIAIVISIILLVMSEQFRDLIKVGTLLFIAHIVYQIWEVLK